MGVKIDFAASSDVRTKRSRVRRIDGVPIHELQMLAGHANITTRRVT